VNYKTDPPKLLSCCKSEVDVAGGKLHNWEVVEVRVGIENGAACYRFECFGEAIGVCFERAASGVAICGSSHYPSFLHPCGDALQRHQERVRRR
jgi:hypothetical protein